MVEHSYPMLYALERREKSIPAGVDISVEYAELSEETPESLSLILGNGKPILESSVCPPVGNPKHEVLSSNPKSVMLI